jgi:hypothetical protein
VPVGVDVGCVDDVAAALEILREDCLGSLGGSAQPQSSPVVIVPRVSGLTRRPERPSVM